ncbi:DUF4112 domain-containing protein [Oharaeibacter diazotrophicus]|uniref:Uncharacterized protein DUF4112 n=1 Tax=Oharaeibacter diazotrophicus TaxID=1920512 RepID=A0A4R6RC09_9HYPH|nr:DUF4112 domain-containing protein [Oharaeibacter diazotrophicus]TDP83196.1 uncharacterized protein DUF4112 [Oharaeibacter diazotrophicus]BBE72025.1 hypothetical protein OHA_1_01612 [Pleomorphomonas sp. SM30]GLS78790.1 hypothetical protein GCM10007904_41270 [Oharaeibacter diazotrophicus]
MTTSTYAFALPRPRTAVDLDAAERRIEAIARLMDAAFRVPGTGIRFGLDSVAGLVPVAGDAVGLLASGWLVYEAQRLGAPEATLRRMAANVAIDAAVGAVPFLGDVFDVFFKANLRNLAILRDHLATLRADRARVVGPSREFTR